MRAAAAGEGADAATATKASRDALPMQHEHVRTCCALRRCYDAVNLSLSLSLATWATSLTPA